MAAFLKGTWFWVKRVILSVGMDHVSWFSQMLCRPPPLPRHSPAFPAASVPVAALWSVDRCWDNSEPVGDLAVSLVCYGCAERRGLQLRAASPTLTPHTRLPRPGPRGGWRDGAGSPMWHCISRCYRLGLAYVSMSINCISLFIYE